MSDESNNSPPRTRRSSFAGQTFADIFGTGRASMSRPIGDSNNNSPPSSYPGPITTAAAQAQRRRFSLTTLGLGNAGTVSSSFGSLRGRNDSLGSANDSIDECAVEDSTGPDSNATPATPFARRVSFGARAMMDIKNGNSPGQSNGRSSPASASTMNAGISSTARAPSMGTISARGSTSGERFNWSDNLRSRAERTSNAGLAGSPAPAAVHQRAKSVAVMEPPVREASREQKRPDHFQERILKGDFYMD